MSATDRSQQPEDQHHPHPATDGASRQGEFLRILTDFYVGKASQSELARALEQLEARTQ